MKKEPLTPEELKAFAKDIIALNTPDTVNADLPQLRGMVAIQGSEGNWNYDAYMHGMYNGMELMLAILEDRDPKYRDAPEKWLCDNTDTTPTVAA